MSDSGSREERWVEFMFPRGKGAAARFVETARAGSLLAAYHATTFLVLSLLASLAAWGAGLGRAWVATPLVAIAAPMVVVLAVVARARSRSFQVMGVFCCQETIAGRSYVLSGARERRVGPSDTIIDLHNDMAGLKEKFFARLDARRPGRRRGLFGLPRPEDEDAAKQVYQELMNESLTAVADAVIAGRVRTDVPLRSRMYMHPTYVSWMAGYIVGSTELIEGSRKNRGLLHRVAQKLVQWSTEGLRLSQLRRNLIFKPSRAWKLYPTRTYMVLPEDRQRFLEELIALGHIPARYRPLLHRRFAEGAPAPGQPVQAEPAPAERAEPATAEG